MHGCLTSFPAVARCSAPEQKARAFRRQETCALLQELALQHGWLAKEARSDGDQWWLHVPAGKGVRPVRQVEEALVEALKARDFITPLGEDDPLRWRISARGQRWLMAQMPGLRRIAPEPAPAGGCVQEKRNEEKVTGEPLPRPPKKARQRLLVRDAETGGLREVEVNLRESPLMWLARRKDAQGRPYLEPHHVAAGEKLRQDYEMACMQPRVTASWDAALVASDRSRLKSGPRDPYPFIDKVLMARERVHQALEATGPELADIVVAVCCLGHGIEAAERALAWPRRSARLVLRIALERLAAHYGIRPARGSREPRWKQTLAWHARDGRPEQLLPEPGNDGNDGATAE